MQQTILIAGHRGFIGRHVVEEFLSHGWSVIGVSRNKLEDRPNFTQYQLDLHTPNGILQLKQILEQHECTTMLNLVWDVSANCHSALTSIDSQYDVLNISRAFIEATVDGKKNLIVVGTNAEYSENFHVHELYELDSDVLKPDSIYGMCKYATYKVLHKMCQDHNIAFIWPRIFSAFGPYMRPTCFMPTLINSIKNNKPFTIKNGLVRTHFTPVEVVATDLYQLIANHANVFIGPINIAAKRGLLTTDVANILIDNLNPDYRLLLTVNNTYYIEQNPSLTRHDKYIVTNGVYRDTIPYIVDMIKHY